MEIRNARMEQLRQLSQSEIHAGAYELLKSFDLYCREHGIAYTLSAGTCLGAVRHGGIIPWDDDIDVDVPMPEFMKLLDCVHRDPLPEGIEFLYGMERGLANYMAKLSNPQTVALIPSRSRRRSFGLWLDILPVFALSDDEQEAQDQILSLRANVRATWPWLNKPSLWDNPRTWLKKTLLADAKQWVYMKRIQEICNRYPFGSTKYVHSVHVYNDEEVRPRKIPTELHYGRILHRFGDGEYPILEDYDQYLSIMYGKDYMTPPPEDQRGGHSHTIYTWR